MNHQNVSCRDRKAIGTLFVLYGLLLVFLGCRTSPNRTELGHMAATVYQWHTLHFDVFHVNPPLTRMITGLPVSLCRPEYNWNMYSSRPQDRSEWALGTAFLKANSPRKFRWCFALAHWSLIPVVLLGGYFGYRLSCDTYGESPGCMFLALWCFSPLLLSWGATICPDAAAAALGLVAVYAFWGWLHWPSWTGAAITGVCLGVLPLTKLTWVIAFGLWPVIWCLWIAPIALGKVDKEMLPVPSLRQLAAVLVVALCVLNTGYLFDGTCRPLGEYVFRSELLHGQEVAENETWVPPSGNRFDGTLLSRIPMPLPAEFVQGIDTQRCDFERGLPSYLRGEWSAHGWWYYYLYALGIKVPLGTSCLIALAVGVTIFGRGFNASWRDEMVMLAPGLAILVFVSSQTGFSVHSRYVIPALPFFFVWISKVARVFEMRPLGRGQRRVAAAIVVAVTWSVGSSLWIYPHSLSYFNELVGGPKRGGEHLLDSNIDWGQDLFYLRDWLDEQPHVVLDGVAFYGSHSAMLAGIPETPRPPAAPVPEWEHANRLSEFVGPKPGWYAVSVNHLYGRSGEFRYFLRFEPVASAGYSIYIYHISLDDANRVRRELGLPELSGGNDFVPADEAGSSGNHLEK